MELKFKQLSEFLGNKKFLMGNEISIADFVMHEAITWNVELDQGLVADYKNITDYVSRFENLPKMKSFFSGDKHFKPFFAPFAFWMNRKV